MTINLKYRPSRPFSKLANMQLGRELWDFMTADKTIHSMKVASDLGHPALAGIEDALLDKFGQAVLPDQIKQMIGEMAKQVMKHEGYVIAQKNVKINSVPFSKGARYRRSDWHLVHVFYNTMNSNDLCFTDTRAGEKLPSLPSGSKWRLRKSFSTPLRGEVAFGISLREVRVEIEQHGYWRL